MALPFLFLRSSSTATTWFGQHDVRRPAIGRTPPRKEVSEIVNMSARLKVLSVFKALHRTRLAVFKDDHRALTAARLKINEEFQKNKNETSEENIDQMIKMGSSVETVLRKAVIQVEHVGEDKILLRPRESLLLENVPYSDMPRKRS